MPRRMLEPEDQDTLKRLFHWLMCLTAIISLVMLGIAYFA